jgi:hypothetical protein
MGPGWWLRLGAELVYDLVTGALEKRPPGPEPVRGLPFRDVEIQVKASREAGPRCALPPLGRQCTRMRGHTGPCAAEPVPLAGRKRI